MRRPLPFVLTVLVLVLALVACSLGQTPAEPTPTLFVLPTAAPTQGEAVSGQTGVTSETFALKGLNTEQLDSFTAIYTVQFSGTDSGGSPASLALQGDALGQRDPLQTQFTVNVSAEGIEGRGSGGLFTATTADNRTYVDLAPFDGEQRCVSFASQRRNPVEDFVIRVDRFFDESTPARLALVDEDTVVNGIPARYYRAEHVEAGDFNDATIDVWAAQDSDAVLRLEVHDEGAFQDYGDGALDLTFEVTSVNEPVTIVVPTDCAGLGG